jgi:hypothetical protein
MLLGFGFMGIFEFKNVYFDLLSSISEALPVINDAWSAETAL